MCSARWLGSNGEDLAAATRHLAPHTLILERVPQRELQIALAALSRHLSEIRTGRIDFGVVPVRMVRPVEGLESELKLLPLRDEEILEQGHVVILEAGTIQKIPNPLLVERTGGRPHAEPV